MRQLVVTPLRWELEYLLSQWAPGTQIQSPRGVPFQIHPLVWVTWSGPGQTPHWPEWPDFDCIYLVGTAGDLTGAARLGEVLWEVVGSPVSPFYSVSMPLTSAQQREEILKTSGCLAVTFESHDFQQTMQLRKQYAEEWRGLSDHCESLSKQEFRDRIPLALAPLSQTLGVRLGLALVR